MAKYIDASAMIAEIERRIKDCDAQSKNPNQLLWAELQAILAFIDTREQPQLPSDISMTQEKFNESIEAWKARYNYPDNIPINGAITFTMRMCTSYPELAKNYYDSLPKITQD